tara:strand:+ start:2274 stop:3482 length:1209 start_codon:yes stop_codon:yes gene_type:complete
MNILDIQEALKDFSEQQLINEMQSPSGNAPQFLVLSELNRRKRMKADFQARQAQQAPTVAEALVASAGVPTQEMTQMSAQMAPSTDMAQNSGVMAMSGGGILDSIRERTIDNPFLRNPRYIDDEDEFDYEQAIEDGFDFALGGGLLKGGLGLGRKTIERLLKGKNKEPSSIFPTIRQSRKPKESKPDEVIQDAVGEEKGMLSKVFSVPGLLSIGGLGSLVAGMFDDDGEGEPKTSPVGVVPDNQQGGFDLTTDARQQELQELYDEYDRLSEKSVRDADMNKYLALAAAGFQLMQPDEGGFAGAASKAGLAGLKTLQDSDAAYNKAVTDRLATRIKLYDATKPKDKADQLAKIAKAISVLQTERERAIDDVTREQINRQIEMLVQQQQAIMGIAQGQNVVTVN